MTKVNGYFWLLKEDENSQTLRMFLEKPTFENMASTSGAYYTENDHRKMLSEETIAECHEDLLMWKPLRAWADCSNSNFGFRISIDTFSHVVIDALKINEPKEFNFEEAK